ncbi:hypothetical protein C8Q74DRAFT_353584 [Fomes fomentarius]|nr:hypothetical protein C8Q74DRAFT_353584 [Fomes fomentarius]
MNGGGCDSLCPYKEDSEFGDVHPFFIRAEDVIFCVPRHYFTSSEVFRGMFTVPPSPNGLVDGTSKERPLFLESISASDFRDFLRVLSFRMACMPQENLGFHKPFRSLPSSWLAVLKLASMWEFTSVRRRALIYLHEEDAITRLVVARQYDMPEWLFPALKELASRATPLTVEELNSLGLDVAVKVIALREAVRGSPKDITVEEVERVVGMKLTTTTR